MTKIPENLIGKDTIVLQKPLTWLQQSFFSVRILLAKLFTNFLARYQQYRQQPPQPSAIKSYPSQPHLHNRIFYPPDLKSDDCPPLFLDIHGGGFIFFNPSIDDAVNAELARRIGCFVISLDYSKAPAAKFPEPTNEIVRTILDILEDESLPFDRDRVVLGGHSAGGNLTVSVAQSPLLQDKLAGIVSWYPSTEVSDDSAPKLLLRPYDVVGEIDPLFEQIPLIVYAYVRPNQDLRDPQLSVLYADRASLPKHVMIIGAENDMLCHEAWRLARRLTGQDDQEDWALDSRTKYAFEQDSVRWRLIRSAKHGYTHFQGGKGPVEVQRKQQAAISFKEVEKFLLEHPFKK